MTPDISLSCRDIERYLGEDESRVHALRGVSLDIAPGTVHAVVGPSGCGKSTLLYILGLLDHPDGGVVMLEAETVSHLPDDELARRRNEFIGFIFQFHFLMEDFTAQENVMIPMRRLGQLSETAMRDRAAELLEAVSLSDKLQRASRHLSGGEQQRVAIARALVNEPKLLLADEPTGNLDSRTGIEVMELIKSLNQSLRMTVVLVTHEQALAEKYVDRLISLADGKVVSDQLNAKATTRGGL